MNNKIIIRRYNTIRDKVKVVDLFSLNTPKYFSRNEEKDLMYYLQNEAEDYYVIEVDGKLIGSGGVNYKESSSIGFLSWDLIHPDFQGKGFGAKLLNFRIDKLKADRNIKQIIVRTSQLVYKFYEKSGFQVVDKVKDYWAKGYDLYKMEYKQK